MYVHRKNLFHDQFALTGCMSCMCHIIKKYRTAIECVVHLRALHIIAVFSHFCILSDAMYSGLLDDALNILNGNNHDVTEHVVVN